ncbi:macrophage mannose receptor 1-like [Amphiura filiformis]|uniref:macrophage mannose receptor 1-like n=1 Tax=Amphiura filiformis TaxID=82378 RepID=UPI003B213C81
MILRIIIFAALLVAVSCQDCGGTWKRYADTCYLVRTRVNVWGEARKDCQTYSGDLAVVKDSGTNQFLYDMLSDTEYSYWVGGHDTTNEGMFEWVDGSLFGSGFTNWGPNQPDDFSQLGEDCVELDTAENNWNDLNCVVPRYYICARDIDTPIKCDEEDGWREFNNKCYLWVPSRRKWQDAEAYCTLLDAHLPAVESQAEQDFLTQTQMAISLAYWLGLSDKYGNQAGDYSWTDPNTQYGDGYYSNWDVNEPKSIFFNGAGDCAAVDDPATGLWKIDRCDKTKRHFCERSAGTCANGWKQFNGQCYQINANNPMTWTDAKHYCEAQAGYLITIMGDAENQFVAVQLPELRGAGNTQIYIGMSDSQIDGNFQWVHGAGVGYTNWNDHQPTDMKGQADCGVIYTGDLSARWDTANCFNPTGFICKIQVGRPVTDIPPDQNVGSCDNGWSLFGDSCYNFVVDDKQSWGNADIACQAMSSRLVSIHTAEEQSFISTRSDAIRERMWLGLHDTGGEGNLSGLTKHPMTLPTGLQENPTMPAGKTVLIRRILFITTACGMTINVIKIITIYARKTSILVVLLQQRNPLRHLYTMTSVAKTGSMMGHQVCMMADVIDLLSLTTRGGMMPCISVVLKEVILSVFLAMMSKTSLMVVCKQPMRALCGLVLVTCQQRVDGNGLMEHQ